MLVIIKEKKALKEVVTKMTYFLLQDDEGYYSSHYQVLYNDSHRNVNCTVNEIFEDKNCQT